MILITTQDEHVEDGDLMRLLDTECSDQEDRMLRMHLAACADCKKRHDRIARLSQRFSALLFQLEEPVPRDITPVPESRKAQTRPDVKPWWSRRVLRVAAVVALILAGAAAVTPVRAWVIDAFRSILGADASAPVQQQTPGSLVSFVPSGSEFLVEFLEQQSTGVLRVYVDTTDAASARIIGRAAGEGFLVQSAGLTIRNTSESSVSYELRLPRTCETFEVRIAGAVVWRYEVRSQTGMQGPWEVDLRGTGQEGSGAKG
jgi:hypothetical protein